jgi:hypothetical protein
LVHPPAAFVDTTAPRLPLIMTVIRPSFVLQRCESQLHFPNGLRTTTSTGLDVRICPPAAVPRTE